jgi:uncharacterized membrane protein YfcA
MDFSGPLWLLASTTFLLAGLVKGVIGMGLPTIAMGLLSLAMPPAEAAAMLIVPSLVTNVWQLLAGPRLGAVVRQLCGMMAGVVLGTIAGAGIIVGNAAGAAAVALGWALVVYAIVGLSGVKFSLPPRHRGWAGVVVGATTGVITGATGVFVIPAVPYLQAIGLEKDDLIQALGLSFTVSTLALGVGLLRMDAFQLASAGLSVLWLVPALGGMFLGQAIRDRFAAPTFRTVFFAGLLLLGIYLAFREIA